MPFIPKEERAELISSPSKATKPGQLTFLIYRELVRCWKESPCWSTADDLHEQFVFDTSDNEFLTELHSRVYFSGWNELCNASHLAWQVFFMEYVYPYELEKKGMNGDVQ